ncbi:bifunctional 4-hydroxy-2-oxoglutarate aldolase/2-dehydro-3-deoxy-phosphogluconate aldolase [Gloeocapsopsis crepidinum LEGE 06123]|uniref:Bifunctional 4-hydroxy-2-oxoglutarate aldolase/2-dehydro-3-deoxy-phosphogluconate aldolase n=1 Tax=Gloeocapsopsis crepidinum LEGE 06123 TaxID=588587 RepID=A0ABR9UXW3_9CHRO|nr:bifunctional 4-hydroxy-2-oxoglutarate aldolase/2-dehydro-3-deoxy-phosphogluconate aldolase [Gloeocapsopsis crepidinum]MBE9192830.1 bifunctional 4-hydroxy-2-oxoglutarate aldolase/2-dehydro-3-deoxy-phosphogluconate aldolase [Gloeocapsopsis crepidinum LEGE 06123]
MMKAWLDLLQRHRAIAVIRTTQSAQGYQMAKAVVAGGMHLIEVTWTSDKSAELIARLQAELPHCTIGTGTLLNLEQLNNAIAAGAKFLFSPHCDTAMIRAAVQQNIPIIPGALSPTEIVHAYTAGASGVKVFPIQAVGGASYIKSLQGPLGHIPLIPTGGVTLSNAREFIVAGAIAVGLASELFPKHLVDTENWEAISQHAKTLMEQLH